MKYFTIYASLQEGDRAARAIEEVFAEYRSRFEQGIYYLEADEPIHSIKIQLSDLEHQEAFLRHHLQGMGGFYSSMPFQNEELRQLVLAQISVVNTLIAIECDRDYDQTLYAHFTRLASLLDAVALLPDGRLLSREGEVIVYGDGRSGTADFQPIAAEKMVLGDVSSSPEGLRRKQGNMEVLRNRGVPVIDHLPELPPAERVQLRGREEIAERAVTLLLLIQYACDVAQQNEILESRALVQDLLAKYGVNQKLTQREWYFLTNPQPAVQEAIQLSWQYEAYWVLLWALGIVEKLEFPDRICDCALAIQAVAECEDFSQFLAKAKLRPAAEILDQADFIYRCDWACVYARINRQEPAAGLNPGVVLERHRALNWLIRHRDAEWDDVSMDT